MADSTPDIDAGLVTLAKLRVYQSFGGDIGAAASGLIPSGPAGGTQSHDLAPGIRDASTTRR